MKRLLTPALVATLAALLLLTGGCMEKLPVCEHEPRDQRDAPTDSAEGGGGPEGRLNDIEVGARDQRRESADVPDEGRPGDVLPRDDSAGDTGLSDDACAPQCGDKQCGDDGCGGLCGTCGRHANCDDGQCVEVECEPDCVGKECGDDGCGGSCGECAGEHLGCLDGVCVCQPDCLGKCGVDDGCGGLCGGCSVNQACMQGVCWDSPAEPGPGMLVITEIMADPGYLPGEVGEWFEIRNVTKVSVRIGQLVVRDDGGDLFVVENLSQVGPGHHYVFGASDDAAINGGAPVNFAWSGFSLDESQDQIIIEYMGQEIDRVEWFGPDWDFQPGSALSLPPESHDSKENDDPAVWCPAKTPFSESGPGLGTPSQLNPDCI